MDKNTIRTSLDLPSGLHRKLHQAASRRGCSARQLILQGIERLVEEAEPAPKRRVKFPLLKATVKPIDLTNEQIYNLIQLP